MISRIILVVILGCWIVDAIVPQPWSLQTGNQEIQLDPRNFVVTTTSTSTLLDRGIERFKQNLFKFPSSGGVRYSLEIVVKSDSENLFLGVDESYDLSVLHTGATITAPTVYGAMWALESFTQIVDWKSNIYTISQLPVTVKDKPRFGWRGLLIDTARHFLDTNAIKRQIDALSASKMNTLHWHAVDAQSFPIYSAKYPDLSAKGAYDPTAIYSTSDIQSIVSYAKDRGVRVVAEFDVPGHAASWGKSDPSLTVRCPRYEQNINNIPLDPTKPHTYDVLKGFLTEMVTLFPDSTLHLGGDEIVYGCWLSNPQIAEWMSKNGIKTGPELAQYFEDTLFTELKSLNKTIVLWEDLFNSGVSFSVEKTIIQVWISKATLATVVKSGHHAITSAAWYLDKQVPNPPATHYLFQDTWIDFYQSDPVANLNLTPAQEALVLGGEAAMWGERADSESIDPQVWPRTVAVAERLWSSQNVVNLTDASARFAVHACNLQRRGIRSAPLGPGFCLLPK